MQSKTTTLFVAAVVVVAVVHVVVGQDWKSAKVPLNVFFKIFIVVQQDLYRPIIRIPISCTTALK